MENEPANFIEVDCSGGRRKKSAQEKMETVRIIAATTVIMGALNLGMVALAHFELVAAILGMSFRSTCGLVSRGYGLVGLSGPYQLATLPGALRDD